MSHSASERKLSKSILSAYLRTKCDKSLFLSLHSDKILEFKGLPAPLDPRPSIGILKDFGNDFEESRNNLLRRAFRHNVLEEGVNATSNLLELLKNVSSVPSIILQGEINPENFRNQILQNLGLDSSTINIIPELAGMIPDIVIVRNKLDSDEEVLTDGTRKPFDISDNRKTLSIVDIKHTSQPNPSYSAEVVLYTLILSNWVAANGLEKSFAVTASPMLWTRSSVEDSALIDLLNKGVSSADSLLEALNKDCDKIPYKFYIQTIRRFFAEDIPRVIKIGEDDWKNLDWHVRGSCSSCDWLGNDSWLTEKDRSKIAANPDHYCAPYAEKIEHLSRIPGISSGARKTLVSNGMTSTTAVAGSTGDETAYRSHSLLKKERRNFPGRATALHTGRVGRDSSVLIATLARNPHLQINASVNYDSSSGLLSSLALSGRISFPYRNTSPIPPQIRLKATPFIVDSISLRDEWVALEGFLDHLASFIEKTETEFKKENYKDKITAQVAFWDEQQYVEVCAAMGRHLPKILNLAKRKAKALAWLFPAEELLERETGAVSPCIVFVNQIIKRAIYVPKAHSLTLFDVAEHYYYETHKPFIPDALYRDYLSDGIPRERIYEIWSHAASIVRANKSIPRTTLINELGKALEAQCKALDSIILRLRKDFKPQLKGNAGVVETSIPTGARNVSFDGKLWIWWDQLDKATFNIEAHRILAEDAERLEASYQAIRLVKRKKILPNGNWVYEVSPDSSEAKLDDNDSYLALGSEKIPGLPLTRLKDIIATASISLCPGDINILNLPFWAAVKVKLISFDRDNLEAIIEVTAKDPDLIPFLEDHSKIDFTSNVYITNNKSNYDQSEITRDILKAIGNPPIAIPDSNALAAMALPAGKVGKSPISPAARVLWDPSMLQDTNKITASEAAAIGVDARTLHNLNDSQTKAIQHACERLLTVIWGPPGTGKTKTLVALIQALIRNSKKHGKGINVLISGPTYKAIEEIVDRLIESLEKDSLTACEMFVGYAKSRVAKNFSTTASHLALVPFYFREGDVQWNKCSESLNDKEKITIVATSCHQSYRFPKHMSNKTIDSIFDIVILDESSQIPVPRALWALAGLKEKGQLIVAGDHLQMPPIQQLDAPVGAEYLVGSIQTYLLKRPFGKPIKTCDLLENYRSSKDVVDFAKTIGYPNNLIPVYPNTKIKLLRNISSLKAGFPTHLPWSEEWSNLMDPQKSTLTLLHKDDNSSQSSEFEARLVAAIAYILKNTVSSRLSGRSSTISHTHPNSEDFWQKVIGIVTPHKAQRALVIRELKKLFPVTPADQIIGAVDTVEKFQGGERHVIIVSYAVGDPEIISGEEAFLMQLERTNVAISRSMAKCIVIMPENLAGHIPKQKKAIETAHALKGFVDEFCNKSENIEFNCGTKGQLKWHG